MARFSKIVLGLIGAFCLQNSAAERAFAQYATDLDLDRATVQSAVNLRRIMPLPSDLDQYQDPGVAPISPTQSKTVENELTAAPSLKPALTMGSTASGGTSTGPYFDLPAPAPADNNGRALAQAQPSTNNEIVPIDLTPVHLPQRTTTFNGFDAFKTQAFYHLPSRMFFDFTLENSIRFELNTYQTNRHYLSDLVYRVLPQHFGRLRPDQKKHGSLPTIFSSAINMISATRLSVAISNQSAPASITTSP